MDFGLNSSVIDQINMVLAQFPVIEQAILYGSKAKGNYKNGSDIDISIKGENIDLKTLNKLHWQLDDLLLPYKIDISVYSSIDNKDLIDHINRIGIVLYKKD